MRRMFRLQVGGQSYSRKPVTVKQKKRAGWEAMPGEREQIDIK